MKLHLKNLLFGVILTFFGLFSTNNYAQSSCCSNKKDVIACNKDHKDGKKESCSSTGNAATSGCSPSGCRGAKTKFGEAKVISTLRLDLIALKAKMEQSKQPKFDSRSYDIHGIIGKTDDESLQIIVKEVKIVEKAFASKLNHKTTAFQLPENKAKQITYLRNRIAALNAVL